MAKRGRVIVPTFPKRAPKRPKPPKQIVWPYKRDRKKEKKVRPGERPQQPPILGPQGTQQLPVQPIPAQPQRGWIAQQPAQPQQQWPQIQQFQPPVGNLWRAMVAAILITLAIIFLINLLSNILPNLNIPGGGDGGGCTCYCDNGKVCTKNSDCPADTSVPGTYVPGVCGCPVNCR